MPQKSIFSDPFQPAPGQVRPGETGVLPSSPQLEAPLRSSVFSEPDDNDTLTESMNVGRQQQPNTAARVQRLQAKTGLPAPLIEQNIDTIEQQAAAKDFDAEKFRADSPLLAKWLAEPKNAAVAHDDVKALGAIETTLRVGLNTVRSIPTGLFRGLNVGTFGALQFGAEALGLSGWGDYFKRARGDAESIASGVRGQQEGAGDLEKAFYSGFESVGMMVPGLLASAATGTPTPMLGMIGLQTGGEAYGQARDANKGIVQSGVFALSQAAVEIATEKIPAKLLLGDIAKNAGFIRTLIHQGVSEVPGEQVATLLQDLNEWATLNPEKPFSSYLEERPSAAVQTLVATLASVGTMTTLATALDRMSGTSASQRVIESLHAAVEESETAKRSPEALSDFIKQASADGVSHVLMPADTFTEYFQAKGDSPSVIAEQLTGNPDAYAFALESGGDISIPIESYLSTMTGSGHEPFFAKELRLAPGQANGRETAELLKATAEEATAETADETKPDGMRSQLIAQMVTAGMDASEAETLALTVDEAFSTVSKRTGFDLSSIVEKWQPEVVDGEQPTQPAAQASTTVHQPAASPFSQEASVEVLDPDDVMTQPNASGESAASLEALSRQANMARRGETFVAYGLDGKRRVLVGPDAVDYRAKPGEIVGVETPNGFRLLDNNNGKFPTTLYQKEAPATPRAVMSDVGFYSRLDQAVLDSKLSKATGEQWKKTIANAKVGVNRDEFAVTRVEDLEDGTSYTRDEILAYFAANRPTVEVTELENESFDKDDSEVQEKATELFDERVDEELDKLDRDEYFGTPTYIEEEIEDEEEVEVEKVDEDDNIVHDKDGNVEYVTETRETTRTVYYPAVEGGYVRAKRGYSVVPREGTELLESNKGYFDTEEEAEREARDILRERDSDDYIDEKMREDAAERVSLDQAVEDAIEELNKDGNGARYGEYVLEPKAVEDSYREVFLTSQTKLPDAKERPRDLVAGNMFARPYDELSGEQKGEVDHVRRQDADATYNWRDGHDLYDDVENPIVRIRLNIRETVDGKRMLFLEEVQPPRPEQQPKMPPIFVKNWRELAFKWALREAAMHGLDGIAWTTGEQQAERYSLEHAVHRITVDDIHEKSPAWNNGRRQLVKLDMIGAPMVRMQVDDQGIAHVIDDVSGRYADLNEKPLAAIIGDELATRIRSGTGEYEIDSEGLAVGGEGLKRLYDFDFKNVANALPVMKKNKLRVGTVQIAVERERMTVIGEELAEGTAYFVRNNGKKVAGPFAESKDAYGWLYANKRAPNDQPAVLISEEMRENFTEGQALFSTDPGGTRGSIQFREGAAPLIKLFAAKNRSTFLHESGHLYLEMMSTLVEQLEAGGEQLTPTQQRFVDDYRNVLVPFLGIDGGLSTAAHEKFARTFEAYVMEGKAPSAGLRVAFARVSRWLVSIYKNLAGLSSAAMFHVEQISPEVRGVLDRLLATDDAIAEAQAEVGANPLFTTAEEAGVDEIEFEGYRGKVQAAADEARVRVRSKVMADLTRQEKAWWKKARTAVRARMQAVVPRRQVYAALAAIRKGETPDGQPFTSGGQGGPLKLSKAALVAQFGEDVLKRLPKPYVYSADGVTPDMAAELLGYATGQALVDDIIAAPKLSDAIESATDAEMLSRHGALAADPAALAEEAEIAVTDVHRDTVVRAELAMLRKLVSNAKPSVRAEKNRAATGKREGVARLRTELPSAQQLKAAVEQQVSAMRLSELRPDRFIASARKNSRLATEAAAKGDFDTAIETKQRELLNLELYRASRKVVDERKAAKIKFDRMFQNDERLAKRRNMDLVNAARALAATYFWPDRRQASALEALELVKQYDVDAFEMLNEEINAVLAQGTNLQSLTVDAFRGMVKAVDSLWTSSLRSQQSLISGQLYQRQQLVEQLVGRLDELPSDGPRTKAMTGLLGMRAALTRVEHWVSFMDGGSGNGLFRRYIFNPIAEAAGNYRTAKNQVLKQYLDIVKSIETTLKPGEIEAAELGYTFSSKAALLHALLHTGNDSNQGKLIKGRLWEQTKWDAFLKRMHDTGVVTAADWQFVQAVWDLHESLKPAAQAAHREMFGTYFSEVTARPVQTPFGEFRGGYVPAVLDPFDSADGTARVNIDAIEGVHPSMFPAPGFTKKRVQQYAEPLALDLALLPQHLDKVLRFVHLTPRAKEVHRLVNDKSFRQKMHGVDPTVVNDLLQPWLQRVVSQQVTESGTTKGGQAVDRVFRAVRSRAGLNMMAGHVVNTLQQFTGIFPAAVKVKPKYLRNALWRYTREHSTFTAFVAESSKFMNTRLTASTFETQQHIEDLLLNPSKYEKLRDFATRHGYFMQTGTQNVVDNIVWGGAYEQAIEKGSEHDDAVLQADSAVRETQGSFAAEDVASVEVQRPFVRLFTMFFGYFNTMANLNGFQLAATARDMGLRKGAGRALYVYAFGFAIPAILSEAIRRSFTGFDEDDDDEYLDDLMSVFFGSQARTLTAMVPGGQVVNAAVNQFATSSPYDDRVSTSPAIATIEQAVSAPKALYDAIVEGKSAKKAVRSTLALLGLLTGLPSGALTRPLGYAADVADGTAEPEGVVDAVQGAVSGR